AVHLQIGLRLQRSSRIQTRRRTRAGTPATIEPAGTSFVTTAPAPIMASSPIVTPAISITPEPMLAPRRTSVGTTVQSDSDCGEPSGFAARGYLSFVNITP